MRYACAGVVVMCATVVQIGTLAQAPAPANATDILKGDVEKVLGTLAKGGDQQILVTALAKSNVGIGVVHWLPGTRGVLSHAQVDEVYYMREGSGTMASGGTMPDGKPLAATSEVVTVLVGPSSSGATIKGGQTRKISAGDIVIIPAGVPHQWVTVDTEMKYIDIRIDSDKILPAGYLNPALKK